MLASGFLGDGADGVQGEAVLFECDDASAVRALRAGVDLQRRAAVRAVDGLHVAVRFGLRAGRPDEIPLVGHELLLVPVAGDKAARCVVERVVDDAGLQPGDEHVVAALLAPAAQVDGQNGDALDVVRLALLLLALQLVIHLGEEGVGAVRTDGRDVLLLPAILHLDVEVRELRGELGLVEGFVELRVLAHRLQLAVCSRGPADAAAGLALLLAAHVRRDEGHDQDDADDPEAEPERPAVGGICVRVAIPVGAVPAGIGAAPVGGISKVGVAGIIAEICARRQRRDQHEHHAQRQRQQTLEPCLFHQVTPFSFSFCFQYNTPTCRMASKTNARRKLSAGIADALIIPDRPLWRRRCTSGACGRRGYWLRRSS